MRRFLFALGFLLGLGLALTGVLIEQTETFIFSFTQNDAQSAIDSRLSSSPVTIEKMGVTTLIKAAKIQFLPSDNARAKVWVRYESAGFGLGVEGDALFEADLHYVQGGDLYLRDLMLLEYSPPSVKQPAGAESVAAKAYATLANRLASKSVNNEKINLQALVKQYAPLLRQSGEKIARDVIESKPIYSINHSDLKSQLVSMSVKEIKTDERSAHVKIDVSTLISPSTLYMLSALVLLLLLGMHLKTKQPLRTSMNR